MTIKMQFFRWIWNMIIKLTTMIKFYPIKLSLVKWFVIHEKNIYWCFHKSAMFGLFVYSFLLTITVFCICKYIFISHSMFNFQYFTDCLLRYISLPVLKMRIFQNRSEILYDFEKFFFMFFLQDSVYLLRVQCFIYGNGLHCDVIWKPLSLSELTSY